MAGEEREVLGVGLEELAERGFAAGAGLRDRALRVGACGVLREEVVFLAGVC